MPCPGLDHPPHFTESRKNLTKNLVCKDLQQFHAPEDGATRQDSAKPSALVLNAINTSGRILTVFDHPGKPD